MKNLIQYLMILKKLNLFFICKVNVYSSFIDNNKIKNNFDKVTNNIHKLSIFNVKLKYNEYIQKQKFNINKIDNYMGKLIHNPVVINEWSNSIYTYNNNTVKLLPSLYKIAFKLIKSYFNFYSKKLETNINKIRARRPRIIKKRRSTNRMLVSNPLLKHNNEKIIFNCYIYNRQNKIYEKKIDKLLSIENVDNNLFIFKKLMLIDKNSSFPSKKKIKKVKKKSIYIKKIIISKIKKQTNELFKNISKIYLKKILKLGYGVTNEQTINKNININDKYVINYDYIKRNLMKNKLYYLKHFIKKSLYKEKLSLRLEQLILFNNYKFNDTYLQPFSDVLKKIFNKEIDFNFINLKYSYLNSYILSDTIVTKLKNKKNKLLSVLNKYLDMYNLPVMDRLTVYNEMYNKEKNLQNIKIMNLNYDLLSMDNNLFNIADNKVIDKNKNIYRIFSENNDNLLSLKNFYRNYKSNKLNVIMLNHIKHKKVSGIRLEAAGRLTKRYTAARSIRKFRYRGNIRNMDSSFKGLSCVLLKGYEKSNLQYSNITSKLRIGSFSIKGWMSGS